jgi:hypothetical protein
LKPPTSFFKPHMHHVWYIYLKPTKLGDFRANVGLHIPWSIWVPLDMGVHAFLTTNSGMI